ncbi:PIN domain-containing protein [Candidatus Woesearchaeota archaeon]|nr:PIN domain-containing protein [Candidatus Woesearchaeota archaeon]
MRLIVDTNRIIAALLKEGTSRAIICSGKVQFFTLEYVIGEILAYKHEIIDKSKLDGNKIELLLELFLDKVEVIPDEEIKQHLQEALKIMKSIDEKDAPILACALAIDNDGIWTEDQHFRRQNAVKVWNNQEILIRLEGR